jgi:arylsulfatase A
MKRSIILGILLAHALPAGAQTSRPNVVLIYTDDQGYGDVSALNPDAKFTTPNLDRLVKEGITFTDGHCSDTVCTPSRYGLLTGRYSWRTGLKRGVMGAEGECLIASGRLTIASLLRESGYRTAMVGKWHLGMVFGGKKGERDWSRPVEDGPTAKGFEYFYGIPASMNYGVLTYIENDRITVPPTLWTAKKPNRIALSDYRIMPPYPAERGDLNLEVAPNFVDEQVLSVFTERAVRWIGETQQEAIRDKPFFLYLAYTSPHKPVAPIEQFRGKSQAGAYGDFMMETDHHIGRVLDALDKYELSENTLVIFTSDNGPETTYQERAKRFKHRSARELRGGKRDLYEGGHRVPFLVRWPHVIKAGRRSAEPVSQTDLLATFAEIVGHKLPDGAGEDSFSLLPALKGENHPQPLRGPIIHHSASGYFAIRDGRWKLNMIRGSGGSLQPKLVEPGLGESPFELYDLHSDIGEQYDVSHEHPEVVERLHTAITRIVTNGRTTSGKPQANDGSAWWPQLTWVSENGSLR